MTLERSTPSEPSVADASDTVTGYVEFYYWKNYYCDPTKEASDVNQQAMSSENWAFFKDVDMYRSKADPTNNFEYLWNMTNPNVGGVDAPANPDPLANSLFNITTLKTLVALG